MLSTTASGTLVGHNFKKPALLPKNAADPTMWLKSSRWRHPNHPHIYFHKEGNIVYARAINKVPSFHKSNRATSSLSEDRPRPQEAASRKYYFRTSSQTKVIRDRRRHDVKTSILGSFLLRPASQARSSQKQREEKWRNEEALMVIEFTI